MERLTVAKLAVASANYAIDRPYDYKIPEELFEQVLPGVRVTVPFGKGNRRSEAIVLALAADSGFEKLKTIETVLDTGPVLSDELIKLALWMRDRFFCTVFDAARAMLPAGMWFKDGVRKIHDKTVSMAVLEIPGEDALLAATQKRSKAPQQAAVLEFLAAVGTAALKDITYFTGASSTTVKALKKQGLISFEQLEVFRKHERRSIAPADKLVLNVEQQNAFDELTKLLSAQKPEAALLYGVTGSGKTAVYIRLIEENIRLGKSTVVLVPEIALTPQLVDTFTSHFGDTVAVLHSSLAIGERYDEWKRIRSGSVRVVIGTRSAVFAPVKNLGILILDEEQEYTYKSENTPRYHARDIAKFRCVQSGALLLLGSATPSIESYYAASSSKYRLFRLDTRFNQMELPSVMIADMKKELQSGNGGTISALLRGELQKNIDRGEQSILFINRRGTHTLIACGECGYTYMCPRCSVSMTYHSANARHMCHYCGYSEPAGSDCPECGGKLKFVGAGTQKVEKELMELFPGIEVIRMDTDTVSVVHSHELLLSKFREKKANILLGTQMVTKGLDFENVTLVGVLSADQSLYVNDYRANERTFSLITQVVGRSGRGAKTGRAVIQTFTPHNQVIALASSQDYDGFYEREIELRKLLGCPPIADLFVISASGLDETAVLSACAKIKDALTAYLRGVGDAKILGPAPAPIMKVNNRFRYTVTVSCQNSRQIRDTVSHITRTFSKDKACKGVVFFADMNPIS